MIAAAAAAPTPPNAPAKRAWCARMSCARRTASASIVSSPWSPVLAFKPVLVAVVYPAPGARSRCAAAASAAIFEAIADNSADAVAIDTGARIGDESYLLRRKKGRNGIEEKKWRKNWEEKIARPKKKKKMNRMRVGVWGARVKISNIHRRN